MAATSSQERSPSPIPSSCHSCRKKKAWGSLPGKLDRAFRIAARRARRSFRTCKEGSVSGIDNGNISPSESASIETVVVPALPLLFFVRTKSTATLCAMARAYEVNEPFLWSNLFLLIQIFVTVSCTMSLRSSSPQYGRIVRTVPRSGPSSCWTTVTQRLVSPCSARLKITSILTTSSGSQPSNRSGTRSVMMTPINHIGDHTISSLYS